MATSFKAEYNNHKFSVLDSGKVQEFKESLKVKAEELIFNGFPEKIIQLNNILETPSFKNKININVRQDLKIAVPKPIPMYRGDGRPPAKRTRHSNKKTAYEDKTEENSDVKLVLAPVPINKHVMELVSIVKPHIRNLIEDSNLLKMWITVMIPKIEDGNNFGVSIQAGTLAEIQSVEGGTSAFFDQISKYYVARGKLISKVRKYPHVDDYRRAVDELDEREYLSLCLMMVEIRNHYCSLHDIVLKNFDKIKKPRVDNATDSFC